MMSIATVKSAGSAGNYYTDKDNYYVIGSMGARWAGQGAEELGLTGGVDQKVFTQLLEGRLPDGNDLSRAQDGANKHRPGYDLTFSAPKSISVMAMLGGDTRLIDADNRSVDVAIKQVETMAFTRVMTDGKSETQLTGNQVMALFNHDTSRDQEPQLHTHIWMPGQMDLIKTVALIFMVADHLSLLTGLNNEWLRLAGRGAFPLFGLVWAMNLAKHPRVLQVSLNRLWVWAVVAQGGWSLTGLRSDEGNILFAFAVAGQALWLTQQRGPDAWPLSLMLILAWLPFSGASFGFPSVMMLLLACGVFMSARGLPVRWPSR